MRRVLAAVPWLLLAVAVGVAGWIGWDAVAAVREAHEAEPVAASTSTLPPATTTSSSSTTTSTSTTSTTTVPETTTTTLLDPLTADPMEVAGLGPACNPEACAPGEVAAWPLADYEWRGMPGVLGLLMNPTVGLVNQSMGRYWSWDGFESAYVAGLVREVGRRQVTDAASAGLCAAAGTPEWCVEPEAWMASVYFGDHPITGEPIIGDFLLGYSTDDMVHAACLTYGPDGYPTGMSGNIVPLEVLLSGGTEHGCAYQPFQPGRAYALDLAVNFTGYSCGDPCPWGEEWHQAQQQFLAAQAGYNDALLAQMNGDEVDLPDALGMLGNIWGLTDKPVLFGNPGITMVVKPDCPLCEQVLDAIRAAGPDLALRQVDLGSDDALALGAEVAPTVLVFDRFHAQHGDPWTGQEVLDDLDGFLEQVCQALAHAPASCRS